ncbi:MAG: alpha-amylase family glycosyl hydrolase [Spirochaetales bacterium]
MKTPSDAGLTLRLTRISDKVPALRSVHQEFHISRKARDQYQFDDALFSSSGNVVFPNFLATRIFAKKMNDLRDPALHPEPSVLPGQLNAMGLIDEILHFVAGLYREENGRDLFGRALDFVALKVGRQETDEVLLRFSHHFPNVEVYKGGDAEGYLRGSTEGLAHREVVFEEVMLLWLANANTAFEPFLELFDDRDLRSETAYGDFMDAVKEFFTTTPLFGPEKQSLIDMLRAPALAVPHSLYGQLQYIKDRWGLILGKFLMRLLSSLDFMKEEERLFWNKDAGGGGSQGYEHALSFTGGAEHEPERFSTDKEWMPKVILLAKSTLVWLDQLTKKYERPILTLREIPDAELDDMAARGFNSLWLIGLWERSKASKTIKVMCGNPEAEASAYSLFDYDIATELGGWNDMNDLRDRCARRGIRVASDMVPNHTSMDSKWVSEHPDWFTQLDYCPYPGYTFNGPDLSQDPNIEVKLEDHYYDRSDASVVFLHRDKRTNRHRFIYHGNDGTSMPWNDTAQLNYLNPETREAIIQVILHVARNFQVIRFDAAMTLAKKHIQRLWYPLPGSGGDIASRAEHAMTKEAFDAAIPEEFWREVVDRVAAEVPDTLLLAEAFWMMEGYFVRTLGMHRVYNSAFMHMFKKEENEKYRYSIKNTLEFDPDILKRYVNFMNNPDEETAAVQFGTGDKYFGVATVMVTMPGTPMFGHGQVEGFREKYGMEYRRAYWDEKDDLGLIERHQREIFPLMHRRYLFAEVANFYLYDLWGSHGSVNQNVFAYSNGTGNEHALVFFNNTWEKASGWIKVSAGYAIKNPDGTKEIQQRDLASALRLTNSPKHFVLLRDQASGLWYLRRSSDLHQSGMFVELGGYQKQVFLDIHELEDGADGLLDRLATELQGAGVNDLQEALKDMTHRSLFHGFTETFHATNFRNLYDVAWGIHPVDEKFWANQEDRLSAFYWRVKDYTGSAIDPSPSIKAALADLKSVLSLTNLVTLFDSKALAPAIGFLDTRLRPPMLLVHVFFAHALIARFGEVVDPKEPVVVARALMEEWYLDRKIQRLFVELGMTGGEAHHLVGIVKLLASIRGDVGSQPATLGVLLRNSDVQSMIGVHQFEGVLWFDKGGFDYLLWWVLAVRVQEILALDATSKVHEAQILGVYQRIEEARKAAAKSAYHFPELMELLDPEADRPKKVKVAAPKAAPKKAAAKKEEPGLF